MVRAEFSWLRITSVSGLLRTRNSALQLHKMSRLFSSAEGLKPSRILCSMQLLTVNCLQSHAMCSKLDLSLQTMKNTNCVSLLKILVLLGYYAAHSGNPLATFRKNLSDPSSRFKKSITLDSSTTIFKGEEIKIFDFSTLEDETD
jgi:hypothetical protein